MKFHTPNKITKKRKRTLSSKEPDTIEWINGMKPGEVLYDIGANVGTYSIYAGLRGVKVYAFEPGFENYAMLNRNIILNELDNVSAYCIAATCNLSIGMLNMSTTEVGGSMNTFDRELDYKLETFTPEYKQGCIGLEIDHIAEWLPKPDYIKIDVDGIEHDVVHGGKKTIIKSKSVLIEINTNLHQHREIVDDMLLWGFKYNQSQVDKATRKKGVNHGIGNYIFRH